VSRWLVSGAIVLAAALSVLATYWDYVVNPWTRDGQVSAQVIQVTPRVSGPIMSLPIVDNQRVKEGDVLFKIDPRTYQAALAQANADLAVARVKLTNARTEERRDREASKTGSGAVSKIELELKRDERLAAEAHLEAAQAQVESADLDLEFTQMSAPLEGYVTHLNLRLGDQAVANQPVLALVDVNSYWVHGFFRETVIANMRAGDRAIVTLMTYPDLPLEGRVESLGWGIAQQDGAAGQDLLPQISPTFEWIRLAQRVPVRIELLDVPDEVSLRVGTTASVLVLTGTAGQHEHVPVATAPRPLQ
jgi:multidrug resistance efflux pump